MMLSAGHCVPNTVNALWGSCKPWVTDCTASLGWNSSVLPAGWTYNMYYGGSGGDSAALEVHSAFAGNWVAYSSWWHWGNNAKVNIWGSTSPVLGETICQGGATTGISCGTVEELSWSFNQPAAPGGIYGPTYIEGMIRAEGMCSQSGDSGGPVTIWHGGLAYGIVNSVGCGAPDFPYFRVSIEPITRALNGSGLQLYGG